VNCLTYGHYVILFLLCKGKNDLSTKYRQYVVFMKDNVVCILDSNPKSILMWWINVYKFTIRITFAVLRCTERGKHSPLDVRSYVVHGNPG